MQTGFFYFWFRDENKKAQPYEVALKTIEVSN